MSKRSTITYLRNTNLYVEARRRYNELKDILQAKEANLGKVPPGKIHILNAKSQPQFYLRKDSSEKSGEYISKANDAKLNLYIQKSYDEKIVKYIRKELSILEIFLKKSDNYPMQIQQLYSNLHHDIKKHILPLDMSDDDYRERWQKLPFEGKPIPDYIPYYETSKKERVRSKSELNIANALEKNGIPYKYECPILLDNGTIIHPDFTLLHVKERKEIYWEHRGMMDDKEYARNSVARMKTLMKNGIWIGKNLIITEETSTNPLGTNEIESVIENYFW